MIKIWTNKIKSALDHLKNHKNRIWGKKIIWCNHKKKKIETVSLANYLLQLWQCTAIIFPILFCSKLNLLTVKINFSVEKLLSTSQNVTGQNLKFRALYIPPEYFL